MHGLASMSNSYVSLRFRSICLVHMRKLSSFSSFPSPGSRTNASNTTSLLSNDIANSKPGSVISPFNDKSISSSVPFIKNAIPRNSNDSYEAYSLSSQLAPANSTIIHSNNANKLRKTQGLESHTSKEGVVDVGKNSILRDTFGRKHTYLRISLTERCNLRCEYCMPAEGVKLRPDGEILTSDEIVKISTTFVNNGVTKIRLTGGEPLVRSDIVDICRQISALKGLQIFGITTNGILLERKLNDLIHVGGITHLNISLDTLIPSRFEKITRRKGFERVRSAIDASLEKAKQGLVNVKVNCVVKRGMNDDEILNFVEWTKDNPHLQVRFIEYMPFDANGWSTKSVVSYLEIVSRIRERYPGFARERSLDGKNPTSKTWKVPGFAGSVGFITSMTDEFCGSCNRLRVTANGNLKACLFGEEEVALRDLIRSGQSIEPFIEKAVKNKKKKLGGHENPESISKGVNRPMILIGG